jgi:hypothetical protein
MRVFKIPAKDLMLGDYLRDVEAKAYRKVTNIEGTIVSLGGEGVAFDLKGKKTVEILDVLTYQKSRAVVPAAVKWRTKLVRAASAA